MKPSDDARLLGYVEATAGGARARREDATQEILVKVMTALASFERRSYLRTWASRAEVYAVRGAAESHGRPRWSRCATFSNHRRGAA